MKSTLYSDFERHSHFFFSFFYKIGKRYKTSIAKIRETEKVRLLCYFSLRTLPKTSSPGPELWKKYFEEKVFMAGNIHGSTQFFKD